MTTVPAWATLVRAPNPGPMTLEGTNTWVLRAGGSRECVVVDPGPLDEGHLRAVAAHGPVAAIIATHSHHDHVAGMARLAELTGAPAPAIPPAALAGLTIETVVTPGHTADSVCFLVTGAGEQAVLTGDTILGRGTAVVAYPDGDLGDYLSSLRRLAGLGPITVLPGHGPVLPDCATVARYYLDHREERLAELRAALRSGARTPREIVEIVYADVDRALWPYAEWSVRAQLSYLGAAQDGASGSAPPDLQDPESAAPL